MPMSPASDRQARGILVAAFAKRHDLIIVSDEIHHDILMPGQTHIPMTAIEGIEEWFVMLTAST